MKNYNIKNGTLIESDSQRVFNYPLSPRGSRISSNIVFVKIDSGILGGTHWKIFYTKDNKSFYFDSSEGTPDKILLKHLPKPII